jgi:hypothetical protein
MSTGQMIIHKSLVLKFILKLNGYRKCGSLKQENVHSESGI